MVEASTLVPLLMFTVCGRYINEPITGTLGRPLREGWMPGRSPYRTNTFAEGSAPSLPLSWIR